MKYFQPRLRPEPLPPSPEKRKRLRVSASRHKTGRGEFAHGLAALCAALVILLPGAALALTYSPPSFDLTADPGATLSLSLKVRNDSVAPETVTLSALNFMGKAGDETSGIPQFYAADQPGDGHGMATWIDFPGKRFTLQPGEQQSLPFKIVVPKDADPGSHFGAVQMTTQTENADQGVGVVGNSISLILLKVNGAVREELKLTSFTAAPGLSDAPPVHFEARLQNEGTVHERPFGEVTVMNRLGRKVAVIPMNRADNKSVLPGMARRLDDDWKGRAPAGASVLVREWDDFALGPYTGALTLRYGNGQTLTASTTFWMFPWLALSLLAAGLAVLAYGLRRFLARYREKVIRAHEEEK